MGTRDVCTPLYVLLVVERPVKNDASSCNKWCLFCRDDVWRRVYCVGDDMVRNTRQHAPLLAVHRTRSGRVLPRHNTRKLVRFHGHHSLLQRCPFLSFPVPVLSCPSLPFPALHPNFFCTLFPSSFILSSFVLFHFGIFHTANGLAWMEKMDKQLLEKKAISKYFRRFYHLIVGFFIDSSFLQRWQRSIKLARCCELHATLFLNYKRSYMMLNNEPSVNYFSHVHLRILSKFSLTTLHHRHFSQCFLFEHNHNSSICRLWSACFEELYHYCIWFSSAALYVHILFMDVIPLVIFCQTC